MKSSAIEIRCYITILIIVITSACLFETGCTGKTIRDPVVYEHYELIPLPQAVGFDDLELRSKRIGTIGNVKVEYIDIIRGDDELRVFLSDPPFEIFAKKKGQTAPRYWSSSPRELRIQHDPVSRENVSEQWMAKPASQEPIPLK